MTYLQPKSICHFEITETNIAQAYVLVCDCSLGLEFRVDCSGLEIINAELMDAYYLQVTHWFNGKIETITKPILL